MIGAMKEKRKKEAEDEKSGNFLTFSDDIADGERGNMNGHMSTSFACGKEFIRSVRVLVTHTDSRCRPACDSVACRVLATSFFITASQLQLTDVSYKSWPLLPQQLHNY